MLEPSRNTGIYTSSDLMAWTLVEDATEWNDEAVFGPGRGHRDPCVIQLEDGRFLQYFAGNDAWNRTGIGLASSADLCHWQREELCHIHDLPDAGFSGILEFPYV